MAIHTVCNRRTPRHCRFDVNACHSTSVERSAPFFRVICPDPLPMGTISSGLSRSISAFSISELLGISIAHTVFQQNTKGGDEMKNTKSLLVGLILLGNIAVSSIA